MLYVIKKVGFFRRLWHVILTRVFGVEVYVFERTTLRGHENWLEPHWLCPGCLKYQPWDFGCADDHPDLCDDCWHDQTQRMKEELDDSSARPGR